MAAKQDDTKRKVLMALPLVALAGLGVLAAYVVAIRQMGKPWVPFPLSLILMEDCARVFFLELDLFNKACLKITIAKGLGYVMILASAGLKLPMILKIIEQRSITGLSTSSLLLESVGLGAGFTSAIKKLNPFSLYGEVVMIYVQNVVILALCLFYTKGKDPAPLLLGALLAYTVAILVLPITANMLIAMGTALSVVSRIPQLLANYKQKHTGVLSIVTQGLQCIGVVVRLLTIAVETGDAAQLFSYGVAFVMNFLMLAQILFYWGNTAKELAKAKATEKKTE